MSIPKPVKDEAINIASQELDQLSKTGAKTKAGKWVRVAERIAAKAILLLKYFSIKTNK